MTNRSGFLRGLAVEAAGNHVICGSENRFRAAIDCRVNGEVRQYGSTADMVRDVAELVAWVSSVMTLLPGDVILTGTPAGVGPLAAGDSVSVTIDGIGTLTNPVIDRD